MTTSTTGNTAIAPRTPRDFLRHFPDCWIQYFDDGPERDSSKALSTSDFDPREAARKQKQGCGVFYSPNAFDGLRRAGNLKRVQAAFVDLDLAGSDAGRTRQSLDERLRQGLEALVAFPLPPHVVVRTRNGLQAVWRVEPLSPADGLALFGEVEDLLVSRFGADPAAKDVTRVLRLPGFLHLKDANSPFLCHVLADRLAEAPYRLLDLGDALRHDPVAAGTAGDSPRTARTEADDWRSDLDGVEEGRRNSAAARISGRLLAGLKAELWETSGWGGLKEWNARNRPPLPETELRGVFDRIAGLEREKRGQSAAGPSAGGSPAGESLRSRADELVRLARDSGALLFVDQFDEPHARVNTPQGRRVCKVKGKEFQQWLARLYYERSARVAPAEAAHAACSTLAGQARYSGDVRPLEQRVARHQGAIWYDLADDRGRAVRVTAEGWTVEDDVPLLFRRAVHQRPQAVPVRGGRLDGLLDLVHFARPEAGRLLLLPYLVTSLVPDVPHPVALVTGPQGASKSTLCRLIRRLVDPTGLEGLSLPPVRELPLLLLRHWYACFDNVSGLPADVSDMLCRAVTGEGVARRQLYSDDEEVVFRYRRCVCLNGVHLSPRPDLLDRSLLFALDRMPPERVRDEASVEAAFEARRPELLGALFTALSGAMRERPRLRFSRLPRMADFACWGAAASEALGLGAAAFLAAYGQNIRERHEEAVHDNAVAQALWDYMAGREAFTGSASELLGELLKFLNPGPRHRLRGLPRTANQLSRQINLLRVDLAQCGLVIESGRTRRGSKLSIRKAAPGPAATLARGAGGRRDGEVSQSSSPVSGPAEADNGWPRGGDDAAATTTPAESAGG